MIKFALDDTGLAFKFETLGSRAQPVFENELQPVWTAACAIRDEARGCREEDETRRKKEAIERQAVDRDVWLAVELI